MRQLCLFSERCHSATPEQGEEEVMKFADFIEIRESCMLKWSLCHMRTCLKDHQVVAPQVVSRLREETLARANYSCRTIRYQAFAK